MIHIALFLKTIFDEPLNISYFDVITVNMV